MKANENTKRNNNNRHNDVTYKNNHKSVQHMHMRRAYTKQTLQ